MTRYSCVPSSKVGDVVELLNDLLSHGLDPNVKLMAYDPEEEKMVEVTGLLMTANAVEICTDED